MCEYAEVGLSGLFQIVKKHLLKYLVLITSYAICIRCPYRESHHTSTRGKQAESQLPGWREHVGQC